MNKLNYDQKKQEIQESFLGDSLTFTDFKNSSELWDSLLELNEKLSWPLEYSSGEEIDFYEINNFFNEALDESEK